MILDIDSRNMYYNVTDMIGLAVNRYKTISVMANLAICRQPHISMWGYFFSKNEKRAEVRTNALYYYNPLNVDVQFMTAKK